MLGACESDMSPPIEHTIDEHLSLSTVFLLHHAHEVIAGLWKVKPGAVDNCYKSILESIKEKRTNFSTALNDWQKKKILEWKNGKTNKDFYYYAPFRVMGFPYINDSDKLKGDNQ